MGVKHSFSLKKTLLSLVLLGILGISGALADEAVYLDFYTGEDARIFFEMGGTNSVTFNGQKYQLDDSFCRYQEDFMIHGGKTVSLYEMSVPRLQQYRFSEGTDVKLGSITIDPPSAMTLYVFSGDHSTGMYMMRDPVALNSAYQEDVYTTYDASGRLQKIDRVYLYEYQNNGQMQYKAMALYIDYENYDAAAAEGAQSANSAAATVDDSVREESKAQMDAVRAQHGERMNAALANQSQAEHSKADSAVEPSSTGAVESGIPPMEDTQGEKQAEEQPVPEVPATTAEIVQKPVQTEESSAAAQTAFPWHWVAIAACAVAIVSIVLLIILLRRSKGAPSQPSDSLANTNTQQRIVQPAAYSNNVALESIPKMEEGAANAEKDTNTLL